MSANNCLITQAATNSSILVSTTKYLASLNAKSFTMLELVAYFVCLPFIGADQVAYSWFIWVFRWKQQPASAGNKFD